MEALKMQAEKWKFFTVGKNPFLNVLSIDVESYA
jgi:hypothetical protein